MTDSTGAATKSEDDAAKREAAHLAGESRGDEPPGDGFVKKSQFIAALNNATAKTDEAIAEAAKLRQELEAMKTRATEKKPPTRDELLDLVRSGDLTQGQADALWEKQLTEKITGKVVAEVGTAAGAQERARKVDAELKAYQEVVPEVWVNGSEEHTKVAKEFNYLVTQLGYPKTKETEAAALRVAFGAVDVLRASKTARTGPADTHAETGGGTKPAAGEADGAPKSLNAEQRDYYEKGIKAGRYKDWAAVKEELKFANSRAKAR